MDIWDTLKKKILKELNDKREMYANSGHPKTQKVLREVEYIKEQIEIVSKNLALKEEEIKIQK